MNISQATPLTVSNPDGIYSCIAISQFEYLVFQPESSNVSVYSCMGNNCTSDGPFSMNQSFLASYFQIAGYWTNNTISGTTTGGWTFHSLNSGNYTVAVGDEWGDLEVLHFSVTASASATTHVSPLSPCNPPTCQELFFSYQSIPKSFAVGDYSVAMVFNGTGYGPIIGNGTEHLFNGYVFVFNIFSIANSASNETLLFNWMPPCNVYSSEHCFQNNTLYAPDPATQVAFGGDVKMMWYTNTTGLYLGVWAVSSGGE